MESPQLNVINQESTPKNRKELVLFWDKKISDAIKCGNTNQVIQATINFLTHALPDVDKISIDEIMDAEPDFSISKREFVDNLKLIIPEQELMLRREITEYHNKKHLRNLQKIRFKAIKELTDKVQWFFDKGARNTVSK